MKLYEYEIDEKSLVGARFVSEVNDELKRALAVEKDERKITQQSIADKLEVNRSVVNRRFMGLENLTVRTIAETLWAIGWEPHFEVKRIDHQGNEPVPHQNQIAKVLRINSSATTTSIGASGVTVSTTSGASK